MLLAQTGNVVGRQASIPHGYAVRPYTPDDAAALARLYFAAYPPGVACATLDEARDDLAATFSGKYGELWLAASPVVLRDDDLVAAVLTVRRGSWEHAPDCPYIIEVFTAAAQRRRGLARAAIQAAMAVLHAAGETRVALTVEDTNAPARALYHSLGFVGVEGT
ncbi:MAG: GNAT family N-acetyltransferase [Chloroflexota bacterium]|nr:GNAT family N-acetyltransferase [Chloroflexota bacterium]